MSQDYLWDRSGAPDPEIARLEKLLAPLAHDARGFQLQPDQFVRLPGPSGVERKPATSRTSRWFGAALLAASVLVMVGGLSLALLSRPAGPSFEVAGLDGVTRLPVGGWLETSDRSTARIKVADIGEVTLEPRTRLRLASTRTGDHRLQLARGTLHAVI